MNPKNEITVSLSPNEARKLLGALRVSVLMDRAIHLMPLIHKLERELRRSEVRYVQVEVLSVRARLKEGE